MTEELKNKIREKALERATTWIMYQGVDPAGVSFGEFILGAEWMYELMTKEAIEARVIDRGKDLPTLAINLTEAFLAIRKINASDGDRVELVIIKKED